MNTKHSPFRSAKASAKYLCHYQKTLTEWPIAYDDL